MALTILRSSSLTNNMQIISKKLLFTGTSLQHVIPACMLSSSVQQVSAPKDELYRQVTIEVKGHDKAVLNSYEKFTAMAANELDVNIVRIYEPPRVITRMSLMKSVFVHKRHFHQYEMRTLFKVFEIKNITGSTASTFLEYIQRNLPEGIAMKVTKHQLEKFPEHIKPPSTAASTTTVSSVQDDTEVPNKVAISAQETIASSTQETAAKTTVLASSSQDKESGDNTKTSLGEVQVSASSTSLPKSKKSKKSSKTKP